MGWVDYFYRVDENQGSTWLGEEGKDEVGFAGEGVEESSRKHEQ